MKNEIQSEISRHKAMIKKKREERLRLEEALAVNAAESFQLTDFVETLKSLQAD
jgi:uncharacterized Rmd1/YagE family protein